MPPLRHAVDHLRRLVRPRPIRDTDRALLAAFASTRNEAAFAELVRRHGSLVLGVCRRVLGHDPAVDDAFQATFLLLARKAGNGGWRDSVAGWLHAAAWHVAQKARRAAHRRLRFAAPADLERIPQPGSPDPLAAAAWSELCQALDQELARLPERLRAPLVLCYLEGRTRDEAAARLGWSLGTFKQRLARARALIRARLTRRGVSLGVAGLPAALTGESVSAAAAADVARLAAGYVCGETVVGSVALLLRESVTMMTLPRWTIRALVAFGGCLLAAGTLWPSWAGKNRAPLNPIAHAAPVREPVPEPGRDLFGDPLPPGAMARFGTVAFRPRTVADQLKFDASGRTLFSLGMTASIWDVATGRELLAVVPPGRDGCLWGAQLDPDGRTLVTLTQDLPKPKLYLRRWSIADQKDTALPELKLAELIVRLRDRGHAVNGPYGPGFTFAPDGNMLAVLDQGGEGVLWDVAMGREIRRLTGAGSPASAIGFTPRGDRIVTSHDDHEFRVWDVATGIEVRRFAGPGVEVTQLSFSADGRRMSAVSFPMKPAAPKVRAVSVWDTESGKVVRNIETDSMRVCWASLAPDGTSVFTTEVVSEVICALRQYNLATGQTRTLSLSQNGGPRVWTLAVAPDGRTLAAATIDGPIHFWDLPSGVEKHPRGLRGNVSETALAPDGRTAWTLTPFGVVFQWDVSSGRELRRLKAEPDLEWSKSVALSSDGKMLAVGELYATDKNGWGKIALWDTATGLLLRRLSARGDHMAFTPDGRTLATIDELDSQIRFWNPVTGKEDRPTIAGQKATDNGRKTTTGLRFLENARKLMAFGSGFAVIWDVESGREERDYPLGGRASHVSADGRLLATVKGRARVNVGPGQTLCEIEVLDLKTGDIVFSAGIDDSVDAVAISPDASVLAVSYGDVRSAIDFWSLKTKDMLGTVTGHRRRIISLAFTPDGRRLVSGSQDTTALVWEVPK